MLEQIEEIRKEATRKIQEILPPNTPFEVDVSIHAEDDTNLRYAGAKSGWLLLGQDGAEWFTSETPENRGETTIFVDMDDKGEITMDDREQPRRPSIEFEKLLELLQVQRPQERGEKGRRFAVTITELEKVYAYYMLYLGSDE